MKVVSNSQGTGGTLFPTPFELLKIPLQTNLVAAARDFMRGHPVAIPSSIEPIQWKGAFDLYEVFAQKFLGWSEEEQKLHLFDRKRQLKAEPDDGFRPKKGGKEDGFEEKLWLHYRPGLPVWLKARGVLTPELEALFVHCQALYNANLSDALVFAGALDEALEQRYSFQDDVINSDDHVLRLLYYFGTCRAYEGCLGKPHTDRDTFTLHGRENIPGLRLKDLTGVIQTQPRTAIALPGDKLREHYGRAFPAPREHDIVDMRPPGSSEVRTSGVFFVNTKTLEYLRCEDRQRTRFRHKES